jgi:hypothetical protein
LEKTDLAVGDSTALEIIFSTKHYNTRVSKRPRITTNEGPPDKNVAINATVIQRPDSTYPIIVKPYKLDLSQFGERVRDRMRFTISNVSDKEVSLALVSDMPSYAKIELPRKIGPGQSASGELSLLEGILGEDFEKSFTIEVDGNEATRFTVPVKRTVKEPTAGQAGAQKGTGDSE